MSGIHRRRPAPIEDADLQTGEAIFRTAGDPPAGPRCFRFDVDPREEDLVTKVSRSLIGAERRDSVSPSIAESWVAVDPLSSKTARTRRCFRRAAGLSASDQRQPSYRLKLLWASARIMPTPPAPSPGS